eukprot:12565216-Alexandrium_andersonii.AAC.1
MARRVWRPPARRHCPSLRTPYQDGYPRVARGLVAVPPDDLEVTRPAIQVLREERSVVSLLEGQDVHICGQDVLPPAGLVQARAIVRPDTKETVAIQR